VVIAGGQVQAIGTPAELRAITGEDDLEEVFVRLAGLDREEAA
jgi:sodium transport system ATP-binding protein